MPIKENYIISKRNILNELRSNNMTLQELRFFSIYLSKINSKDINTRIVRFPLADFQKIMDFPKLNIKYLDAATNNLLSKIVRIPNENGGFIKFQLFKKCILEMDKYGEWFIEINAHDDALPLMFEFKDKYFTYQLWNTLHLKSTNQLRMYEILKQYEKLGERIISIEELKELLGISVKEYPRYGDFKMKVIDICQKALADNTDIRFTYEVTGKRGRGGKVNYLKFTISKNKNYVNQLSLEDFIDLSPEKNFEYDYEEFNEPKKRLSFFAQACNNEFCLEQIQVLYNLLLQILPYESLKDDIKIYDYLKFKYDELLHRATQAKITHRFGYLKKIIEADL